MLKQKYNLAFLSLRIRKLFYIRLHFIHREGDKILLLKVPCLR